MAVSECSHAALTYFAIVSVAYSFQTLAQQENEHRFLQLKLLHMQICHFHKLWQLTISAFGSTKTIFLNPGILNPLHHKQENLDNTCAMSVLFQPITLNKSKQPGFSNVS